MASQQRAIDILKNSANLKPTRRVVLLSSGVEFEFWSTALTMAEREKVQKLVKSDDPGAFALRLLVDKALDASGSRMFEPGEIAELKHEVRDEDLQKCMLAVLQEDESADDMKSV